MGCGCGGGSRYTNRGSYTARGGHATPQQWVVTFPDGRSETFDDDTEAYRQLRMRGGGIRQQDKVPA